MALLGQHIELSFMSCYFLLFLKEKKKTLKGGFKPKGSPDPTLRTTGLGQFLGVQGAVSPAVAWLSPWQAAGPVTWVPGGFRLPPKGIPSGGEGGAWAQSWT